MSELNSSTDKKGEYQPNDLGIGKGERIGDLAIAVTQSAIEESLTANSGHCLIAESIKAAVPKAGFVSVDLQSIRFTDRDAGFRYVFLTPRSAQLALIEFDQGEKPEPFRFRLGRPVQIIKTAKRKLKDGKPVEERRRVSKSAGSDAVPIRLGGKTPPMGVLSNARGAIRVFGLRRANPGMGAEK